MNWINSFIQSEVLVHSSINEELRTKASCEYILYCYINQSFTHLDIDTVSTLKKIETTSKLEYYKPLLDVCLNRNNGEFVEKIDCLESKYVQSIFNKDFDFIYWTNIIIHYIKSFLSKGLDTENSYNLTHIIFYSTNFGLNEYSSEMNAQIKSILIEFVELAINRARKDFNWDLIRELYLCLIILAPIKLFEVSKSVSLEDKRIKSKYGWYLSDGNNRLFYEQNYDNLCLKEKYSLFHTTLICSILENKLRTTPYKKNC